MATATHARHGNLTPIHHLHMTAFDGLMHIKALRAVSETLVSKGGANSPTFPMIVSVMGTALSETPEKPVEKPEPAHPSVRQSDLPWHEPKPAKEDKRAPDLVARILDHPNYRQADQDVDYLNQDETRGLRLQLDYRKAETLLADHGVEHSVVVFGSTRVSERATAEDRLEKLDANCARKPEDDNAATCRAIARRLMEKSRFYEIAREFGRLISATEAGRTGRLALVTGGGPGLMEAANRGAHDVGARSIGFNITLPHRQYPNPYLTTELCFRFHYFAIRKLHFLLRARALVFFPGGFGTLDELFEALTLIQTRKIAPVPIILVGEAYWNRAVDFDFLVEEGVIDPEDRELLWFAETAQEVWEDIVRWYDRAGLPLFDTSK